MTRFAFGRELEEDAAVPADAYVVGEQPWWDLAQGPSVLSSSRSLREQLRRAPAKGVVVTRREARELAPGTPMRARADALVAKWLRTRHLAPMAHAAAVAPFAALDARAIFVASVADDVVGVLSARPLSVPVARVIEHVRSARPATKDPGTHLRAG